MSELVELVGKRTKTVLIGGEEYVLGNITLGDMARFEAEVGPWEENAKTPRGICWLWWRCLVHGGHEIGVEEASDLLDIDDLVTITPTINELISRHAAAKPEDADAVGEAGTATSPSASSASAEISDGVSTT